MNTLRTIVADDEPLARQRIVGLLQQYENVEVVRECADAEETLLAIRQQQPDLVFLDVQMPCGDGFQVLNAIEGEAAPAVIFVTAYDEHALRAFEVRALDYLLKPFDDARFDAALRRALEHAARRQNGELGRRMLSLVDEVRPRATPQGRIVVKSGGRIYFLEPHDIDWVEAAGNYLKLHAGGAVHMVRDTISAFEERLPSNTFMRIHRSRIVNLDRVKELQPWANGQHIVLLKNGTRLVLSRGYRNKLRERVGETR